ncbi:hypothetical protein Plec18170_008590, partial [Paecilomyces lecythidis]
SGAEWLNQVHPVAEICENFGYTLLSATFDPIMDIKRIRLESQKYPTVQEALHLLQTFSTLNVHGPNLEGTYAAQGFNRLACLCTLLFMILEVTSPATNATLSRETQNTLVSIDTNLWETRTQWTNSIDILLQFLHHQLIDEPKGALHTHFVIPFAESLSSLTWDAQNGAEECLFYILL